MKKNTLLALFAAVAIVQLAIPASMIVEKESILRHGRLFKFKTAPVDPYDAFRGRYVALGIEASNAPPIPGQELNYKQSVYAVIEEASDGFARVASLSLERPPGDNCFRVLVYYTGPNNVRLTMPFERFYMDENLAPKAEQAYREHTRQANHDAYVTVRVKSGKAVLENLYVGDKPIREFLLQETK